MHVGWATARMDAAAAPHTSAAEQRVGGRYKARPAVITIRRPRLDVHRQSPDRAPAIPAPKTPARCPFSANWRARPATNDVDARARGPASFGPALFVVSSAVRQWWS